MTSYTNETRVKDVPQASMILEIERMLKNTLMDFGITMAQDVFSHTVRRLTFLIQSKYKGLILGEVRYVFEAMTERLTGKVCVSSLMQLLQKYYDEKIDRQRHEYEENELQIQRDYVNCMNTPLGSAIIWKIQQKEATGTYPTQSLREIAEKIKSGEIVFKYSKPRGFQRNF